MLTPSTGRVLIARGVGSITLTLRHWELKSTATLTLDEARELVRQLSEAILRKGVEAEESRLEESFQDLVFTRPTHGSPALDTDAAKLIALGQDPGPVLEDFSDLL
jgi:hypothetical protein